MPEIATQDLLTDRFCTFEIVGTQKTGKTFSLHTMLKHLEHQTALPKNLYLFDLDGDGAEALLTALEKHSHAPWARRPEDGGRLKVFRYNQRARRMAEGTAPDRQQDPFIDFVRDLNSVVNLVGQDGNWKDPAIAPGCIVIDPCTSFTEMCFDYICRKRGKEVGGSREQGAVSEDGKVLKYIEPMDWVSLQDKTLEMIKVIKSLPCHRIVTFHEELIQEMVAGTLSMDRNVPAIQPKATGQIYNLPLLSGKLQSSIGKNFSVILYTRYYPAATRNDCYQWLTVPSESEHVKTVGARSKTDLQPRIPQDFCKLLD